ncbi:MAG: hypothetical protein ABIZ70_05815 [Gemmatimonadales bacterium]
MRAAVVLFALLATGLPAAASAQTAAPDYTGTWKVDAGADVKNGPREVIIRGDSSASWGKETVRWRIKGEKISIALGGEWETYKVKLKPKESTLTLSGGDLQKPVTLKRVGPATPRPANVKVPEDPDTAG